MSYKFEPLLHNQILRYWATLKTIFIAQNYKYSNIYKHFVHKDSSYYYTFINILITKFNSLICLS